MSRNKSIYQNTIPPIQPDCLLPKFAIPNFSPKFPKDSALNKLSHEFRTDSLLGVNVPLCDLSIYSNCAPEEFDVDDFKFYKELGDKSEKSMLRVPQAQAPRPQQYHQPRILQRRIQEQPQSSVYLKSKSFYSSTDDPAIQEQLQHAFNGNVPEGEVHLIKPQKPLISFINRQSAKPIPKDSFVLVSKGRKYLKVHEFPINDGQPKVAERAFSIIERNYDSSKPEKIYLFADEQGNYVLGKMRKAFTLSQIAATDMKRERMIATPVVFENFVAEENRHKTPDENERDATPERTRHSNGSSGRSSRSSGSSRSPRSSSSSSSRSSRSNSEDEQRKEHDHKDKKNSSESSDSERRVDRHSSSSDRERKGSASSLSSSDNEKKDESKNSSRNSSSSNENRRSSSESHSDNEPKRRDSSQSEREDNRHSSHSNSEREENRHSSHSNSEREENRHSSHSNSEREENRHSSHSNSEREENNRQSSHSNSEREDNRQSSQSNSEKEDNRPSSHSNSEREENRQSNSENEQKEGNDDQNSSRNSSSDNDRKSYSSSDGENRNRRSSSSNSSASNSSSKSSRRNSASSDSDNN